jgi:hypothetical protein
MKKDWRDYEHYIFNHFRKIYPQAKITRDVRLDGRFSGSRRQVDILVEFPNTGFDLRIAVECKFFNEKVDVSVVDSFVGFLQDVGANKGIIITNKGCTAAAESRAATDPSDIEVRIIEFEDLGLFQGFGGIILFHPDSALVLMAPSGWIVDAMVGDDFDAFYPFGLDFKEANARNEWICIKSVFKTKQIFTIDSLLKDIRRIAAKKFPNVVYSFDEPPKIESAAATRVNDIRCTSCEFGRDKYEHTIFLDVADSIFYAILYTPSIYQQVYLKKFCSMISRVHIFTPGATIGKLRDASLSYIF